MTLPCMAHEHTDRPDPEGPVLVADGGSREEAPGNPRGRQRPRHPIGYLIERSEE